MPTLNNLMKLPSVYGAIAFTDSGEIEEIQGKLDQDFAEIVAQLCTANLAIYRMQATGWQKQTGQQGFLPERGFTFLSLDHLIMGMHGKAVIAERKGFDHDLAYKTFNDLAKAPISKGKPKS
jgi:roadblock/LC7 domain-containing protein